MEVTIEIKISLSERVLSYFDLSYEHRKLIEEDGDKGKAFLKPLVDLIAFNPGKGLPIKIIDLDKILDLVSKYDKDSKTITSIEDPIIKTKIVLVLMLEGFMLNNINTGDKTREKIVSHLYSTLNPLRAILHSTNRSEFNDLRDFDKFNDSQEGLLENYFIFLNKFRGHPEQKSYHKLKEAFDEYRRLVTQWEPHNPVWHGAVDFLQDRYSHWSSEDASKNINELIRVNYNLMQGADFSRQAISTKFKISRIVVSYYTLASLFPAHESFNQAFLYSDDFRKALVSDGMIFWKVKNVEDIEKTSLAFSRLVKGDVFNKRMARKIINKVRSTLNSKNVDEGTNFFYFNGAGMEIPEQIKTVISTSVNRPSIVIRNKRYKNDKEFFEITLDENPYMLSWLASGTGIASIGDGYESNGQLSEYISYHKDTIITNNSLSVENLTKTAFLLNSGQGSFSKPLFLGARPKTTFQTDGALKAIKLKRYNAVDVNVHHELKDCLVILLLPYIGPSADLMTSINFKNQTGAIIITSC